MSDRRFGRREVVLGAGAVGLSLVTGVVVVTRASDDGAGDDGPSSSAPDTTLPPPGPVDAVAGVAAVGAAYLASAPDTDEAGLRAALPELTGAGPAELLPQFAVLEPRVREDFTAGTTVTLDGWVLAQTEAQAAALVALTR